MRVLIVLFLLLTVDVHGQFTNVLVSDQNNPNEPAIIINPNNTDNIFAAANLNNYYVSNDGGQTWTENTLTSTFGVWGDPVLLIDPDDNFYFFHLSYLGTADSWLDRIVCQKSTDNGASFSNGTYFGLNGSKDQDKEWAQLDRNNGNIYAFWTEFDMYNSNSPTCETRIQFSRSTDSGDTWSNPIHINEVNGNCEDEDLTVEGAVPAIGPNGEIFVSWAGPSGIVFDRSLDFGDTWLNQDILVDTMPNGWDFTIPGIDRANGFPVTMCDISGGDHHGTIYINWSDQRNGENDTDIWLKKSTDNGNTWSDAVRVNDDVAGKHQFFSWMTIDQTNGYIYIVFYDRRNYNDANTDVYLARSTDGGTTFENFKISDTPFLPNEGIFFGDYNNISAHNGIIRPIWTRLHNGDLSIWTALINDNDFLGYDDLAHSEFLFENYPNPAKEEGYVSFKIKEGSANVNLDIYNALGEKISTVIDNESYNYGKHVIKISFEEYHMQKGVYFYQLRVDTKMKSKKIVVK